MRPDHRARLAAAVVRFQADIRRLVRTVPRPERARLLAKLDLPTARSAAAKAGTRNAAAAATRRQPAARARPAAAGTRARPAATRRTRKRVKPPAAEAIAAPVIATRAVAEASTEPVVAKPAVAEPAASAAARAEPAAGSTAAPGKPVSAKGGSKRVRWTREAIINELASWMLSGTAIDASFVKRHGPPGLVPAALRVFGRFDAALNVAGLHVAKLYPDGPPAS